MIGTAARRDPSMRGQAAWVAGLGAAVVAGIVAATLPPGIVGALAAAISVGIIVSGVTTGRSRLLLVTGAFVYLAAFHWVYVDWVVPLYAYTGLIDSGPGLPSLIVMTVAAAVPVAWLPIALRRPSEIVLWFLYLFGYVPATLIPIYVLGPDIWAVLPFEVLLLVAFVGLGLMQRLPRAEPGWAGLGPRSFERLILVLGLGSLAYLVVFFGIPTYIPNFVTAYDARAAFAEAQGNVPAAGYIVPWAGNFIFPFLITLGLVRRRWLLLALGVAGDFLIYSHSGAKADLFNIALVPLLYVVIRYASVRFGTVLMWGSVLLLGLTATATAITGSGWPLALYAVRLIALPGQLTADYLEFFTSHATYELSQSFLRGLVASPYPLDPPHLIGVLYFHATVNANANLWADAIANFGLAGVVPFTLILGAVLWILDSVGAGRNLVVFGPTLGIAGLSLANGALFTSILTAGIAIAIVLIALMPRDVAETSGDPASPRSPA